MLIHKVGGRPFQMPPEQFAKFRRDVLSKKYFAIDLARKFGITKHNSLKLAKQILGVERFFRGETYPPLSSVFPERHDGRCTPADCLTLLNKIFPIGLPHEPDYVLVSAVIDMLVEVFPFWRSASKPVMENLGSHLVAAVATLRGAEGALVN